MRRLIAALGRRPRVPLMLMLAGSMAALVGLGRLGFDSSLASLTLPDDPARVFNEKIRKMFGDEEVGVVAVIVDDVYTVEVVEALARLTHEIAAVEGVSRTLSLANASDPTFDVFNPPPLLQRGKVDARSVRALRERVGANPIYVPNLVNEEGTAVAVTVFFENAVTAEDEAAVDQDVITLVRAYDGPGEAYYTGMSHIRVQAVQLMRGDLMRFLPASLGVMMLVLWILFRSAYAAVLPLFSVALGVGTLTGMMGWLDVPITMTTLVLPSLLLVIGGSYAVHVVAIYLDLSRRTGSRAVPRDRRFSATLATVGVPVMVSALTTGVGFGALAIHPIPAIAGLGKWAVMGIAIVAVGSLVGIPLTFLSFRPLAERRQARQAEADAALESASLDSDSVEAALADHAIADAAPATSATNPESMTRLDRALVGVGGWAIDHRRFVFVFAFLILVISAAGASRIESDTNFLKAFRSDASVRVANRMIAENLVGPSPITVIVQSGERDYFKSIAPLRRIKDFQDFLESLDTVDETVSLLDYLEELDLGLQASGGGISVDDEGNLVDLPPPPSFWQAPTEQLPEVFQLVASSPRTFAGLVDNEFRTLNITLRTRITGSRQTQELMEQVQNYANVIFPGSVTTQLTGGMVIMSEASSRIVGGQLESLGLAFSVIFIVLSFMFLSLRVSFAAMVPNVIPVAVFFGVMGWTGVELNLATSIIGAVALGIAVDDTIHYMSRLNSIVKVSPTQRDALLTTLMEVGRPAIATSLTLTAGFLVMCVSGFAIISQFGALAAIAMMTALATDLVLLPAILATVPVVSVFDLVSYRLGESPHLTIPLFEGLGSFAVRLVVLLGVLRGYDRGEYLARAGEVANEMYLVLEGEAEIRISGQRIPLSRGAIVGEMGLLRHSPRGADVVAMEHVEVLVIDEDFLRRLRVRYPRFASRFFLNIASILSDRLEAANERTKAQELRLRELNPPE